MMERSISSSSSSTSNSWGLAGRVQEPSTRDAVFQRFFHSGVTMAQLKDAALKDRLFTKSLEVEGGVLGRSMAWKLFLSKHEPLNENLPPRAASLVQQLKEKRTRYAQLLVEKTLPPAGFNDGAGAGAAARSSAGGALKSLSLNNPLSLHDENPWHEWFASLDLKKTISQDVERTFPDIAFFREARVQEELTNILLIYSLTHPSIGYRQGMHEILAPLYHAVFIDAVSEDAESATVDQELRELCSVKHIGADSWALLEAVMSGVSIWYEWQEPNPRASKAAGATQSKLGGHVNVVVPIQEGQNGMQQYIAPIVKACNKVQNDLLKRCDPTLWKAMQSAGIEPQIYGIRWLRLLFTREFPMGDVMKMWDGLFASDPTMELALWVCVAMLIRIRNELIPADYSGQLTALLRYPSPPSTRPQGRVNHTCLLLQQALFLKASPNPSASATIAMENRTTLGIPIEVPAPAPPPTPRRAAPRRQNGEGPSYLGHIRQASSPPLGIPEMLARGILERGESLGINKTLISAVAELKKNIPDIAANLMRSPAAQDAEFPLEDERSPWEGRAQLETLSELKNLKRRDKHLGDSLGWIVDTLLQDEGSVEDVEKLKRKRKEAVESLAYVRDVLISEAMSLDQERLVGEEEASRRKALREAKPTQPRPVPTIETSRARQTERAFARSPPGPSFGSGAIPRMALPRKPPPTAGLQDPLGALGR